MNRRLKTVSQPPPTAFANVIVLVAVFLWLPTTAWGHKFNVFAYVEADKVMVEGYYGGKAKAIACLVEVLNSDGKKMLEGKTNAQGEYSFMLKDLPPTTGELTIVLHATGGHKALCRLKLPESSAYPTEKSTHQTQPELKEAKQTATDPAPSMMEHQNAELLKKVVDEVIDAKLQPIIQMLSSQQKLLVEQKEKSPSLTEMLGGLGWIFGLVGVAAYFMSLAKSRKP